MHKCIFGQSNCQDLLRRIPTKFTLYFSIFYFIFYEVLKFIRIPGIKINFEKEFFGTQ
jgi:hypothetical protein